MIDKFLVHSDTFMEDYYNMDDKLIKCEGSFVALTSLLKEGLEFYNYIVDKKLFQDNEQIQQILLQTNAKAGLLAVTEENAKNITLKNSFDIWQELHSTLIALSLLVLQETNDNE